MVRVCAARVGLTVLCALMDSVASSPTDWVLAFEDEFDTLNTNVWHVMDGFGHVATERQWYTADEVFADGQGHLVLRTRYRPEVAQDGREWTSGAVISSPEGSTFFQSLRSNTTVPPVTKGGRDSIGFTQAFGKFEWRAKLPRANPTIWPALWMLPEAHQQGQCWPTGGEIDVMEMWGGLRNNAILSSFHLGRECGVDIQPKHGEVGRTATGIDYSADFHTYSVEWDESSLKFFVDGVSNGVMMSSVPLTPYFMIMNTAICGADYCQTGDLPHEEVRMLIDYVRVYKRAPSSFVEQQAIIV